MKNYSEKEDEVKKIMYKKRKLSDENEAVNSMQNSKRKRENEDAQMG